MALTAPKSLRDPSPLAGEAGRGGGPGLDASGAAYSEFSLDPWNRPSVKGGLTKLEWLAGHALSGILASGPHDCTPSELAHDAVSHARALLVALARGEQTP